MFLIRESNVNDIKEIVNIHQKAFASFLMTELGPGFLRQYYSSVLTYPDKIFLVIEDENNGVVGFSAGFVYPEKFYSHLRSKKVNMALCSAIYVLVRPFLWGRIMNNIVRMDRRAKGLEYKGNVCEVSSIAVKPNMAGKGLGKLLIAAFLKKAREKGAQKVYLTTDALNNDYTNMFYQKLGFSLERTFQVASKRVMNEYVISLTD
ncbi:MAG: GNAT family N-acetyltransferase [Bacillota bacterium]